MTACSGMCCPIKPTSQVAQQVPGRLLQEQPGVMHPAYHVLALCPGLELCTVKASG